MFVPVVRDSHQEKVKVISDTTETVFNLLEKCHANDKKNIPLFGVFKENKLLGLFFDKDIAQAFCKENSPRKMKTKGIKEVSIKEWPSLASFVEACQFT